MLISTCFGAIFFVSNSNLIGLRFAFGLVFVVGTRTDVFFSTKTGVVTDSLTLYIQNDWGSQPSNLKNWDYVNHHDLFLKASFPWRAGAN